MNYLEGLKEIISEYSNVFPQNISDDIKLDDVVLNLDVLDRANIIMDIEEAFEIKVDFNFPHDISIKQIEKNIRLKLE